MDRTVRTSNSLRITLKMFAACCVIAGTKSTCSWKKLPVLRESRV